MTECPTCYYNNGAVCINHCYYTTLPLRVCFDPYGKQISYLTSMYNVCSGYRPDLERFTKIVGKSKL